MNTADCEVESEEVTLTGSLQLWPKKKLGKHDCKDKGEDVTLRGSLVRQ